jgi:anthranilate phosphoribosyltransferase
MSNNIKNIFDDMFTNKLDDNYIKNYLIDLYKKGESFEDISQAVLSMRNHMIPLNINESLKNSLIDNCGTGGDHSNSFNISTTVSILLASCECNVAKHGNKSITSSSGSSNCLKELGLNLNISVDKLHILLEDTNFVFLNAINHHPYMKYIMPIRKSIPHRTIFNILGPLCNPAGVTKQLIGIFNKDYINNIIYALKKLNTKKAVVLSSKDGMDEISISDITYASILENDNIKEFIIDPTKYNIKLSPKDSILGGTPLQNAKITKNILNGKEKGAKLDIILLNSAMALVVDNKARDIQDGLQIAKDSISSSKASKKLEEIIRVSKLL